MLPASTAQMHTAARWLGQTATAHTVFLNDRANCVAHTWAHMTNFTDFKVVSRYH